jgi:hypothetical protein
MGEVISTPLQTDNPMIIDYATKHRTDFGDASLLEPVIFLVIQLACFWCQPFCLVQLQAQILFPLTTLRR